MSYEIKQNKYLLIIDCFENIPCNPCESVCPNKVIIVGNPITNIPKIKNPNECIGCGMCVACCPGQAIFLVNSKYSKKKCAITFSYEFNKKFKINQNVIAIDSNGKKVCRAKIISLKVNKKYDKTVLITILIPKEKYKLVKGIKI